MKLTSTGVNKQVLAGAKGWAGLAPSSSYGAGSYGIRVAMYDVGTPSQGWVAWPPESSADSPSTWGVISDISMGEFSEVLPIGIMLALSTAAVMVSLSYLRKPP